MEKIWKCKIGGKVGDMPAGADGPMRRAVQTAFETLTGVEASFTFSGWGATLTEGERAVHENRAPNWDAMQEAIDAGDGTLHGAIEYWHEEALRLRAELETERMRLVACSVIALANTPESAASARDMHPDYQSPYCDDVARAIVREIALRAELAECQEDAEKWRTYYEARKRAVIDAGMGKIILRDAARKGEGG